MVFHKEGRARLKSKLNRRRTKAVDLSQQADKQVEKFLIRRFERLISVRRFVFLWTLLFIFLLSCIVAQIRALSSYYQSLQPVPGGLYSEGLIGTFTNASPIYATGTANLALSRLVFSGLYKYDNNNQLVGDLATDWIVSPSQTSYTVHLKKGVTWHDGQPFNANDVVFTYKTIQKVAAQSPLYNSWKDIKITSPDPYSVVFELRNPLSSFPYALTNGIVPEHILATAQPEQLRTVPFNTAPVGTGPFKWKYIETTGMSSQDRQQRISLAAFNKYWQGHPNLDGFSLITFSNEKYLTQAFEKKQINAISGLESLPEGLSEDKSAEVHNTPLTSAVMAFFKNTNPLLNQKIRQALVSGVDRRGLGNLSPYPLKLVDEPLLRNQLGYSPGSAQLPYNVEYANQLLDQEGWTKDSTGKRYKNSQPLTFNLSSQDTQQYTKVAHFLQDEWTKLGIKVDVRYYTSDDIQSSIITNHDYDVLLYGISIGVDPDVFAYWDSSQASLSSQGHLNLSEYKSNVADQSLEAARTRADAGLRALKYKTFITAWSQDAPALVLYQPNFLYVTRGPIFGFDRRADNGSADRFYNVYNWMVRQKRQTTN